MDFEKIQKNQDKEILELKNIIKQQNETIELLKERLIDIADDIDKINGSYYCDSGRTLKWEW